MSVLDTWSFYSFRTKSSTNQLAKDWLYTAPCMQINPHHLKKKKKKKNPTKIPIDLDLSK